MQSSGKTHISSATPVQKLFFLAGEQSGDLHGSAVIEALKKFSPDLEIHGIGGELMEKAGMKRLHSSDEMAIVGIVEVVKNLKLLKRIEYDVKSWLKRERPVAVVLIDYPGFNKRIAKYAKSLGIWVIYYIPPQVWAWNPGRAKGFSEVTDEAIVLFPFEVDIWKENGVEVNWYGHPLVGRVNPELSKEDFRTKFNLNGKRLVSLLPGSRNQEVDKILPVLLDAAEIISKQAPDTDFVISQTSAVSDDLMSAHLEGHDSLNVVVCKEDARSLIAASDLCLIKSGTVTLEAAMLEIPMVVVYKLNPFTELFGRMVITLKHVSLPNIIAGKTIVPELLMWDFTPERTAAEALKLLNDKELYKKTKDSLKAARELLGEQGTEKRVAEHISKRIKALGEKA